MVLIIPCGVLRRGVGMRTRSPTGSPISLTTNDLIPVPPISMTSVRRGVATGRRWSILGAI